MKFKLIAFIAAVGAASHLLAGFSAEIAAGEVRIEVESDLDKIDQGRDFGLVLRVTHRPDITVKIPDIEAVRARFEGFTLAEGFAGEEERLEDGTLRKSQRWRLIPEPGADRYRLKPFAYEVSDNLKSANTRSYPTRPVAFPVEKLDDAAGEAEVTPEPYWIPPTWKMILAWALSIAGGAALLFLFWYLAKRIRREVRLRKMTPSERAFAELGELLADNLPGRGLFKDYYILLTRIVRKYIERAHGIKAPEQTTEEFLQAASGNSHFTPETISTLAAFLQSADLVKFAGWESDTYVAEGAALTARKFIECDAEACRREAAAALKGGV